MNVFSPRAFAVIMIAAMTSAGFSLIGCGTEEEPLPWVEENQAPDNQEEPADTHLVTLFDETVDLNNGLSDVIELEVPDNVLSMSITISDGPQIGNYTVTDWIGPDEFVVVREGWAASTQTGICFPDCNNRVVMANEGATAALAPNNPDSRVDPGTHSFQIFGGVLQTGGRITDTVRVQVLTKVVGSEVAETGILDLNIYFTGANGWTAESAQEDIAFQTILDDIDELYSKVGVSLGEISYNDVSSDYQVIETLNGANNDLSKLFSESANAPLDGPSLFIVDELRSPFGGGGGGGGVLGIAGGIPGPILTHGTPQSGVAIAYSNIQGAGNIANVTAHELGHYLGLFHTSEHFAFGGMPGHDPLPDTPEDDVSYLMHAGGSGGNLSDWQGRVMRKNPWMRHDQE